MRSVSILTALASFAFIAGCSGGAGNFTIGPDGGVVAPPANGADAAASGGGEQNTAPHALGSITLGEFHLSGDSESMPLVAIAFVPDVAAKKSCSEKVAGCEIATLPKCNKSKSTVTGCDSEEACVWDDQCRPTCEPIPSCEEEPCAEAESFDGGPISFRGTTSAITLRPPYRYEAGEDGAPFIGGDELGVKAQGAVGAGFEAFDEKFTATTLLQTKPSLDELPLEKVFGTGPLTVGWVPGNDSILVTVTSGGGSATCKADDSAGSFDVPRAVIDRVRTRIGDEGKDSTITLNVARQRTDVRKEKKTKGQLQGRNVQPEGWLNLTTTSIESTDYEGCGGDLSACGSSCVDKKTDPDHCGDCGRACASGETCTAGTCEVVTCVQGPENTLARCSDGCSNDGDAYVDCDDYNCCSVLTNCPPTTACGQ